MHCTKHGVCSHLHTLRCVDCKLRPLNVQQCVWHAPPLTALPAAEEMACSPRMASRAWAIPCRR